MRREHLVQGTADQTAGPFGRLALHCRGISRSPRAIIKLPDRVLQVFPEGSSEHLHGIRPQWSMCIRYCFESLHKPLRSNNRCCYSVRKLDADLRRPLSQVHHLLSQGLDVLTAGCKQLLGLRIGRERCLELFPQPSIRTQRVLPCEPVRSDGSTLKMMHVGQCEHCVRSPPHCQPSGDRREQRCQHAQRSPHSGPSFPINDAASVGWPAAHDRCPEIDFVQRVRPPFCVEVSLP